MRRTVVYGSAAALITVAVVLTLLGWGEDAATFPDGQALVLGFVQGFTELLPISSSGHLIIVPWLGDWTYLKEHEEFNKTFDVALHLGTLVAVVAYFWNDLIGYLIAWLRSLRRRSIETENERIGWLIVVASIPAAIIGAAGQSGIEKRLGEPWQIAIPMGVFALVPYRADRRPERKNVGEMSLKPGLLIGLAQSLALAPGGLAVGHHDQRGAISRADAGRRRTALIPPARPDRSRRRRAEGLYGRREGRTATRVGSRLHPARDSERRQGCGVLMRVAICDGQEHQRARRAVLEMAPSCNDDSMSGFTAGALRRGRRGRVGTSVISFNLT